MDCRIHFRRDVDGGGRVATWQGGSLAVTAVSKQNTPRRSIPAFLPIWTPLRWVLYAFVPSSLLLAVTTYITTDLASVPLLWILPLAIYLLTFVLTFARRPLLPHRWMVRLLPIISLSMAIAMLLEATEPMLLLVTGNLILLFVVAMVCHGELALGRPAPQHLGLFYLCLALGGALGGAFNGLLAPLIFPGLFEYPLLLVLACLLGLSTRRRVDDRFAVGDVLWPVGLGASTATMILLRRRLHRSFSASPVFYAT